MKVHVPVEPNDQHIMEFDATGSGLSQEELARNILSVAKEWVERYDNEHSH